MKKLYLFSSVYLSKKMTKGYQIIIFPNKIYAWVIKKRPLQNNIITVWHEIIDDSNLVNKNLEQ